MRSVCSGSECPGNALPSLGVRRAARAALWTGPNAGQAVPTQSLAPPEEPSVRPQRCPFLTASRMAVLPPQALLCSTSLCGCWWPWACLPASPLPGPPRHHRTPQQNTPPQEQRTDPQSGPELPWKPNFFLMILSNMQALWCHCEARPHSGHFSFPMIMSHFVNFHEHHPQAALPRKGRLVDEGSPVFEGYMVAWLSPLAALSRGRCPESLSRPTCCVSAVGAPGHACASRWKVVNGSRYEPGTDNHIEVSQ